MLIVRAVFFAVLMLFLGGAFAQSQETPPITPHAQVGRHSFDASKPQPGSRNKSEFAEIIAPVVHPNSAVDATQQADDESARHAIEDSEFWVIFGHRLKITDSLLAAFTLLLIFVGVAQAFVLNRTDKNAHKAANAAIASARVAQDALVASRRPWILVDIELASPIEFDSSGLRLTLKFSLNNKGSDPAFNVSPEWKIISNRSGPFVVIREQEKWCAETKQRFNGPNCGGFTIFPDQPRSIFITATMVQSDIDADVAMDEVRKMMIESGREVRGPVIMPVIIGCVDYQFGSPPEHHQTRFAYELHDKGTNEMSLHGNLVLVTPGVVQEGRFSLVPMLIQRNAFFAD